MENENARDLAGLRLFLRIAETGSISKAAQILQATQPVISRRLAAVEQAWGGRLLHRTGRGVVLTDLGERALPKIRELLDQADLLAAQISRTKTLPSGLVRIATISSAARMFVPSLLENLKQRQLDVRLEIVEGDVRQIEEWQSEGRFDLSIFYRYGRPQQHETSLVTVDSCIVGRADDPILEGDSFPFRRLDGLPLALSAKPNTTRNILDLVSRRSGIDINVTIEPSSVALQTLIAQQQGYYTILPRFAVGDLVDAGILKAVPIVDPPLVRIIVASQGVGRPLTAAARDIFTFIRQNLAQTLRS